MWFRKKPEPLECVGCGCLMGHARKKVSVRYGMSTSEASTMIYFPPLPCIELYCGRCAPPYDSKYIAGAEKRFYRNHPAQEVEVSEKGKDIKVENPH